MGKPLTGAPDPDAVLNILESAVLNRNFENYRSVLADSFRYVADTNTEAMYPNIDWANWGIEQEVGFLERLLSPVLNARLRLTDQINERGMPYDQKAHYEITYQIEIEGRVFISEGTFIFVETDNRW